MMDREKVVENLEKAKTVIEDWVPILKQYNTPFGIDCAIALLKEKQEPVKPLSIKREMFDPFHRSVAWCPKCDCLWIMYIDENMHYCPECGRAVKWE